MIFRKSLTEGKIPNLWRLANVSPIFKKGSRVDRKNNRPVSLISILLKLMEGVLRDVLIGFSIRNNMISEKQHGFVPVKSCVTNLLETFDFLTNALSEGHNVDEILPDLSKAFDLVHHRRLFHKNTLVWCTE